MSILGLGKGGNGIEGLKYNFLCLFYYVLSYTHLYGK